MKIIVKIVNKSHRMEHYRIIKMYIWAISEDFRHTLFTITGMNFTYYLLTLGNYSKNYILLHISRIITRIRDYVFIYPVSGVWIISITEWSDSHLFIVLSYGISEINFYSKTMYSIVDNGEVTYYKLY